MDLTYPDLQFLAGSWAKERSCNQPASLIPNTFHLSVPGCFGLGEGFSLIPEIPKSHLSSLERRWSSGKGQKLLLTCSGFTWNQEPLTFHYPWISRKKPFTSWECWPWESQKGSLGYLQGMGITGKGWTRIRRLNWGFTRNYKNIIPNEVQWRRMTLCREPLSNAA